MQNSALIRAGGQRHFTRNSTCKLVQNEYLGSRISVSKTASWYPFWYRVKTGKSFALWRRSTNLTGTIFDRIGAALPVTRDQYSHNRAMRKLDDIDSRMLAYSCVESDIQMAESYRRIWSDRRSHDGTLDVEEILLTFEMRSRLLPRKSFKNASLPPVKYSKNELPLPTMRCAEKAILN